MLQSSNLARLGPDVLVGEHDGVADGYYDAGAFEAVRALGTLVKLGATNGGRDRSLCVDTLWVSAADDDTVDVHVHLVELVAPRVGSGEGVGYRTRHIGTLTATAGAETGDGAFVPDALGGDPLLVADGLAWVASEYGEALFRALGGPLDDNDENAATPVLHSPEDGTPAAVWFPELGRAWAVLLEPDGEADAVVGAIGKRYT